MNRRVPLLTQPQEIFDIISCGSLTGGSCNIHFGGGGSEILQDLGGFEEFEFGIATTKTTA